MTISLLHKFHSGLADDMTTPGVVHPSNWNDQHGFTGTPGMTVVFDTNGNAAEAPPAAGPPGPAGPIGPAGPSGSQGSAGPAGAQGSQGPAGSPGAQGPPGAAGAAGPTGAPGAASTVPGPQGPVGPTGPAGAAGQTAIIVGEFTNQSPSNLPTNGVIPANWDSAGVPPAQLTMQLGQALLYTVNQHVWCYVGTGVNAAGWIDLGGAQGPVGPQGPQGVAGPAGTPGTAGATGPAGPAGSQGPQGPPGTAGTPGVDGAVGPAGAAGSQGPQGVQGVQGPIGPTGAAGSNGAQGPAGPQGPQGVPGAAGQTSILVGEFTNQAPSALPPSGIIPANWDAPGSPPAQITMQAGQAMLYTVNDHIWCYVGTGMVAAGWIDLEGAQGPAGPVGPQGAQGNPGPQGPAGPQGIQGLTGAAGAVGATGATGAQGAQGLQGVAGPQGSTGAVGPAGAQGVQGNTGPAGTTGAQGPQGNPGAAGATGPAGSTGPPGAGYLATSSTSAPIQTGSVTVTTQTGLAYQVGARCRLSQDANNWMEGPVTAYSSSTGSLTVNVDLTSAMVAALRAPVPGQLSGLTLVYSSAAVFVISPGGACSDDNSTMMVLSASGFQKTTGAWTLGTGGGALDTGTKAASTWYHVFLIYNPTTAAVDALISLSLTPTMPSGFTVKRRIGSIKTDTSSNILAWQQVCDEFVWGTSPAWDIASNAAASASGTYFTVPNVPPGVRVVAIVSGVMNTLPQYGNLQPGDQYRTASEWNFGTSAVAGSGWGAGLFRILTNPSQQILFTAGATFGAGLFLGTVGWVDYRGK